VTVDCTSDGASSPSEARGPGLSSLDDLDVSIPRSGVAVVALKGEHDLGTAAELRSLLETLVADNPLVLVDVTEAEFIDSSVIDNLIRTDRQARSADQRFILVAGTKPIVSAALRVSGLLDHLDCASSVEEALSPS
jgi:anti-anti-sigma factor